MGKIKLGVLVFISVFYLSGCVAFQKIELGYSPSTYTGKIKSTNSIKVTVEDERPFILNGDKQSSYIGHLRGGYGNTFDVLTKGEIALAEKFFNDIRKELNAIGFSSGLSNENRVLNVSIIDYNFDAMINGRFWYELKVVVLNAEGVVLAEDTIKETHVIKGNIWVGAVGAMKKEIPKLYEGIIEKIVRDNDVILDALK